jgi:tetratricopeptide (TPR) repeat protein
MQAMDIIALNNNAVDIIALNNNAVNLMRHGSFQNAIPYFLSALRELHRITGVRNQSMNMDPVDPIADDNSVSRAFVRKVKSVALGDTLSYLKPSIYRDQDAFSVFDRAFLIDSFDLASIYSSEGQNFTTTVLLYNMSLAYQLLGMQDLPTQQKNLKKAMKVYRMAAAILEKSGDEANDLVFLAVSNNMGHIYSHFWETQESQRCIDCLQAGLHAIKQDSKVEILEDEVHTFQMNVLVMQRQKVVAAAA